MAAKWKKVARKVGRKLRKSLGIPFGPAMHIGKIYARKGYVSPYELPEKLKEFVFYETLCECCGPELQVRGPNGTDNFYEVLKYGQS